MKTKRLLPLISILLILSFIPACNLPSPAQADMANSAAQFCETRGFIYEDRTDSAGNQSGVCIFSAGDECEGWAYYRGECGPQPDPTQPPATATELPIPSETPTPELETYRDESFRFELKYPPAWNLQVKHLGDFSPQSTLLEFVYQNWLLTIHIKMVGDLTVTGGGLGAGDIQSFDTINLFGNNVQGNGLIYENEIKSIWYAAQTTDLEIYAKLVDNGQGEYSAILVNDEIAQDVKDILQSLVRTGEPLPIPQPTSFFVPTQTTAPLSCTMNAQLVVGSQAQVTAGPPNTLRSLPGRESDSLVIGSIPGGGIVEVLDGPVCKSGYHWWKVEYGSLAGWTAEGFGGTYWILTYQSSGDEESSDSEEVDGWVGVVVSAEDLPQVDDYFQMMDQNGSRYGIHSLDADLIEMLEAYRDTGTALKIWGTLYRGRMDAYNTQIEVTRIEEF